MSKIQLFVTAKSDQVPDLLWFGSLDPVRIRNETDADPQHRFIVYMAFVISSVCELKVYFIFMLMESFSKISRFMF
jgi:hypothetical protein